MKIEQTMRDNLPDLEMEDESVNDSSTESSVFESPKQPATPYGGLTNLGNTCYMASALQMIASADKFIDALDDSTSSDLKKSLLDVIRRIRAGETVRPDEFKDAVDERSPLFLGYLQQDSMEFLTTLLDLLDEDYKKKDMPEKKEEKTDESMETSETIDDQEECESSHDPAFLYKKPRFEEPCRANFSEFDVDAISELLHSSSDAFILPEVSCTSITSTPTYKLVGGRMNTADVVLHPLSEYPVKATAAVESTESAENEEDDSAMVSSPIDEHFTMTIRARLTCDSCKYTRSHKETFLHLPLEIGTDCCYIEDGLRKFFAPCTQELKCEKCFAESATQTQEILQLPNILLLNFKRFIVDVSPDYSSVSYRKDGSSVYFDEDMSLDSDLGVFSEFLAPECEMAGCYELTSVVNHIGSSASCGHYTADAKRDDKWYRFNDSFVEAISGSAVVEESRQTAYMVMYQLK